MREILQRIILDRYKEQGRFDKFFSLLYKSLLILFLLSDYPLLFKILAFLLLLINIARDVLDSKIRKNVHTATVKEYSYSIGMSILESILFMILIFFMGFDLLGIVIAIMLAFSINFEMRVLLDFRKRAKERDINQKGTPF